MTRRRVRRRGALWVLALMPWLCGAGSRRSADEAVFSSTDAAASPSTAPISSAAARSSMPNLTARDLPVIFSNDKRARKSAPVSIGVVSDGKGKSVAVGVSARLDEGRPLEVILWGGGGAIVGSFAGPLGAIVGGAVGAAIGMVIGTVMPRKQRSPTFRD